MHQKTLAWFLGSALLLAGGPAAAFTLLDIPQEQLAPSNTVTDATTLQTQVAPLSNTIRTQLLTHLRPRKSDKAANLGIKLAANASPDSRSDFNYLADRFDGGDGNGAGGGASALWVSNTINSLENDFSRTAFHGATNNLVVGYDFTRSDRYVLGLSVGYEASNFTTAFNTGDERTRGFNAIPYFALLLSDSWSLDLIGGYGQFDTKQARTIGLAPFVTTSVTSQFESTRDFVAVNLTNVLGTGDWKLTSALGGLSTARKADAYTESDGSVVAGSKQRVDQGNFGMEGAYGRGAGEAYAGFLYEYTRNPVTVQFASGPQPAVDHDSVLATAGWRYYGKGLTGNFAFTSRLGQENVKEYGFTMMLRVDL